MKKFLALILIGCLAAVPALSADSTTKPAAGIGAASLSPQDQKDVARIETYMNELRSLSGEFSQTSDNGEYRHGKIAIQRPGKMRVTYDAPSKDFIVADGTFVSLWDGELQQQSSVALSSSLGDLILRDHIKFADDKLRGWHILDPQGRVTGISLENSHEGVTLDENQFHFVPPNFGKSKASGGK